MSKDWTGAGRTCICLGMKNTLRLRHFRMPRTCCARRVGHSRRCFAERMARTLAEHRKLVASVGPFRASEILTERARRQEAGR